MIQLVCFPKIVYALRSYLIIINGSILFIHQVSTCREHGVGLLDAVETRVGAFSRVGGACTRICAYE